MTEVERLEQWAGVPRELAELVVNYAETYGVPVKEIRGPSRKAERVWIRRSITKLARYRSDPFSYWEIGRALNRDSSTIHNLEKRALATRNGRRV